MRLRFPRIVFLASCLVAVPAFSQASSWSRVYSGSPWYSARGGPLPGGDIGIIATYNDGSWDRAGLLRVDGAGAVVWQGQRVFDGGGMPPYITHSGVTPSGNFFVAVTHNAFESRGNIYFYDVAGNPMGDRPVVAWELCTDEWWVNQVAVDAAGSVFATGGVWDAFGDCSAGEVAPWASGAVLVGPLASDVWYFDGIEATTDGYFTVGRSSRVPNGIWLFDYRAWASYGVRWQKTFELPGPNQWWGNPAMQDVGGRRVVVARQRNVAIDSSWLLVLDAGGTPVLSRTYSSVLCTDAIDVGVGGSLLLCRRGPDLRPTLLRLDPRGDLLWAREYDAGTTRAYWWNSVWQEADGTFRAVGILGDSPWLTALEADGTLISPCISSTDISASIVVSTVAPIVVDTDAAEAGPAGVGGLYPTNLLDPSTLVELDPCCLPAAPEVISAVNARRNGADVILEWNADPNAASYHVWTVAFARDIPAARQGPGSPAQGVAGCSPPAPAAGPSCVDVGAIARTGLVFYSVLGVCASGVEGP